MAIKLNSFVDIISTVPTKDHEGFVTKSDSVVANVRAYFETKNSTEKWRNNAVFSEATALFRFRVIPKVKINSTMIIVCNNERYNIISVEDVHQCGRYIECLGKKVEGSV